MRGKQWIGSMSALAVMATGQVMAGPAPAAYAGDWGGCSASIAGKYAKGRCVNVNRKWRVKANCKLQGDVVSEWIIQRGGDVTTETRTPCDFGVRAATVEERAL